MLKSPNTGWGQYRLAHRWTVENSILHVIFVWGSIRRMQNLLPFTLGLLLMVSSLSSQVMASEQQQGGSPWAGAYIGILGVGASGEVKGTARTGDGEITAGSASENANSSFRGGGGGLLLGYQHHYPNGIVIGLEADWAWLSLKDEQSDLVTNGGNYHGMLKSSISRETQWISTTRLLAGYGDGPWMVNVTAGLAAASIVETRTSYKGFSSPYRTEAQFSEKSEAIPLGWTVGFGGSWQISDAWSLRADYLLTQFDQVQFSFPNARAGVQSFNTVVGRQSRNDYDLQMIRIGLTYSFGNP